MTLVLVLPVSPTRKKMGRPTRRSPCLEAERRRSASRTNASISSLPAPGGETLALRVFNLLHYGHNAQVNALCLMLLALAVAPLVIWKACCMVRGACLAPTQHAD